VPRRAKADYAAAKRWRWGDAVMEENWLRRPPPCPGCCAARRICGVMRCWSGAQLCGAWWVLALRSSAAGRCFASP